MRFPGCQQGVESSRHQFADRRSGGERTLPQAPDQAAWKPDRKDVFAVGDGHGGGQLLGFAQVAIGLASRDGELAGEAFDGVGQVRILLQQRAGEIEPAGFLGIADARHVTYNIYSTYLMSSLVVERADALEREVTFCVGGVRTPHLRNIAHSAPYMHDGHLKTLKEVLDFYIGAGNSNDFRDEEIKELDYLTAQERTDLIAFMEALTGDYPENVGPPSADVPAAEEPATASPEGATP